MMKADVNFKCHNCGASMTFNNFLKKIDTQLQKQYVLEKFRDGKTGKGSIVEDPKFHFEKPVFKKKKKLKLPKAIENPRASGYSDGKKIRSI